MTTDLGSIEDDTLDILTLRNGSSKYLRQKAYKGSYSVSWFRLFRIYFIVAFSNFGLALSPDSGR